MRGTGRIGNPGDEYFGEEQDRGGVGVLRVCVGCNGCVMCGCNGCVICQVWGVMGVSYVWV